MKDSKKYLKKTQKLYSSLQHKHDKGKMPTYDDPVEAIVYGIISETVSVPAAKAAIKKFADYFVDWNDLRVSRAEEIVELLGEDTDATREVALVLTTVLKSIFNKTNTVSLEFLKKTGKRPAKEFLEKIESLSHFAVSYCMLTAMQAHAIPVTVRMVEYLKVNQLVHPDADAQEIEGFLTRQISAANAYEFYTLLHLESDMVTVVKKKKVKTATKVIKKTVKKKAVEKKVAKKKVVKKTKKKTKDV